MNQATLDLITALQTSISNLVSAVETKHGELDGKSLAAVNTAITTLLDGADTDNDTLAKLGARITQVQTTVANLDDVLASDAEVAAALASVNEAWANADDGVKTLLAQKADKTEVTQMGSDTLDAAKAYFDQSLGEFTQSLTETFNNATNRINQL